MLLDSKQSRQTFEYPKVTTFDVIKEYWKSLSRFKFNLFLTVFGMLIAVIGGSVITPIFYKKFFDTLNILSADPIKDVSILVPIIFTILGINLINWAGWRVSWFSTNRIEGNVMADCLQRSFDYLIEHSHNFFISNFAGSLVQRINRFARAFEAIFERVFYDISSLIIKIIGAGVVLYLIQPGIAIAMGIWVVIFLCVSFYFTKKKLKYDIKAAETNSKITGMLSDAVSNHGSIQFFSGFKDESRRIDGEVTPFKRLNIFRWDFAAYIDAVQALLSIGIEFVVFYFGVKYLGLGLISLGTFVLIQSYILNIGSSLWSFSRVVRDIHQGVADAKEMVEILHLPHEIMDIAGAKTLEIKSGNIEFKNVSFAFGKYGDKDKHVFKNLNLFIKAGEKVALIGSSGAGKSTLVKLLLRLHDIREGEILVDGQNIKGVTQESLRKNISLVPQDPVLFHRTLMDNIRYGKRESTDEQVIEAAKLAHCDIFIKEFPHKYETYVGERGVKLSGGERQRVAIARAILKSAPILVLDEATSSLDSHSEALIQDALATLMKNKTTLVIAHRLSTIRKMDRIIVLGKDGVLEEGSHDGLIQANGAYAKLWNLQAGGFASENIEEMMDH